jgi:hypothetical protein
MTDRIAAGPKLAKLGVLFSLLTLLLAFGLGAAFGLYEDDIKGHLTREAEAVKDTVYKGDTAKMKKITDKSWVYCKRAHLHAAGLGAIALAITIYLGLTGTSGISGCIRSVGSLSIGVGALGYAVFWGLAALKAPGLGSTGAAKESLAWLAKPATGLCLLGLLCAFAAFFGSVCCCCCKKQEQQD